MGRYILKRILWMIPIILGVTVLVFTMMTICPGDPATIILGSLATEESLAAKRVELGLDQPYLTRLVKYLSDVYLHFNLGSSWISKISIVSELKVRLPRTLVLSLFTTALSFGLGIPFGISAAKNQGKWQDSLCMVIAMIGSSMPNFWLAMMLVLLFAVKLKWLPALGIGAGLAGLKYYILPAFSNFATGMASAARQTRSSMLDVIRSDYITTARAKGVPEKSVINKHALKNALIPIVTLMGTAFGNMLGGALIIETIFSIPGMGTYVIGAVGNRDYPVVQAGTIFLAIVFSIFMLLVDIVYAMIDPRIKALYTAGSKKKVKKEAKA
ncbi:MAG: ABC transporter permease [Lachnospiraceae bacterium]|mgnify:CR=1 FL=1|nr:ABC transporter permease [Lachnospiraceae bacterium]